MHSRFAAAALIFVCASAHAQDAPRADPPVLEIGARSRRGIASTNALDATASGSSLDVLKRVTMPFSLGDIIREAPGARILSTGGLGSQQTVSLRGANTDETLVMLDEIPLNTPDGNAFDLSVFPAELFERVNVFRGGAPVWLGSGAIGGVLQLVPRRNDPEGLRASAGGGMYGTYQSTAGSTFSTSRGLSSHTALVLRGSQNDYPYRDDRGTLFDSTDDRTFKLKNADYSDASGFQDLSMPLGPGTLHVVALGAVRGGGLSGPAAQPTPLVRQENARALTAASYTLEGGETLQRKLQLVASGSYNVYRFTDLNGQLGTSRYTASNNRSFRAFLRSAGSLELTRWLRADAVGSYSFDTYLPYDFFIRPGPGATTRHDVAGALELVAHGSLGPLRFELRPSVRFEWSNTEGNVRYQNMPLSFDKKLTRPTARIGGAVEVHKGVALSGSYATGTRLPTFFEMFGDGGLTLPSPMLKPVSSQSADGGVVVKGKVGIVSGSAELRGFWQARSNTIQARRTNQYQVVFENLSTVHQHGIESMLSGELTRWFRANGSFTWLDTETGLGTRLPLRPKFIAFGRPELYVPIERGWVSSASFATEVWHRSFAFYDNANLPYAPACTKLGFGAGVSFFSERVRMSARLDDALDARCVDLVGFPLQGRTVFFSLSYREVAPNAS